MKSPERIETDRLLLRRPLMADAASIFSRYATDHQVTRYLIWHTHRTIEHTRTFLRFSDAEWERWPVGPYLIESKNDGQLLGGAGLAFESETAVTVGYVLARDAWGRGYATEALRAMVDLVRELGIPQLSALCHPSHVASQHVLEKCGFQRDGLCERYAVFPNLRPDKQDCLRYVRSPV